MKYPKGHNKAGQQRKQGRRLGWQLRYKHPQTDKRVSTTFWGSRKDADDELEFLETASAAGLSADPDIRNLTVGVLRARALADYRYLNPPSPTSEGQERHHPTYKAFENQMKNLAPLDDRLVRTITSADIDDFLSSYRLQDGKSPSTETLKTLVAKMNILFGYAVRWGVIPESANPMRNRKQTTVLTERAIKWAPSRTEVENVAAILDEEATYLGAMLRVLYWTGMRLEEALGLEVGQVDFERRRIRITGAVTVSGGRRTETTTKTPAGARDVPIVGQTLDPLQLLVDRARRLKSDYVFAGTRPSRSPREMSEKRSKRARNAISYSVWRRKLADAAQTAADRFGQRPFSSLDCRHGFATNCLNAGMSATEVAVLLGHSTPKIVMSRYQGLVDRDLSSTADALTVRFADL